MQTGKARGNPSIAAWRKCSDQCYNTGQRNAGNLVPVTGVAVNNVTTWASSEIAIRAGFCIVHLPLKKHFAD